VPDVIIHCVGSSSVGATAAAPAQEYERTVGTARDVLEFAAGAAPRAAVVCLSSGAVYGDASRRPTPETAPLKPISIYGEHKVAVEKLCASYAAERGLQVSVVRLFSVYGRELRKQLLFDACNKARRGEGLFGGTGDESRDWLHVTDAAGLLMLAAKRATRECPIVNGGTGRAVSVRDVLQELFSHFAEAPKPRFTGESRPGDPLHFEADIAAARSWGWSPKTSWREGLRDYAAWFKSEVA
jgi:UDP-glucose 4-epimerase